MKKKGFTLIELLAVIIILAIIALIATPIVLNVVNEARESANDSSVKLYVHTIELEMEKRKLLGGNLPSECSIQEDGNLLCGEETVVVEMGGTKPTGGSINFSNGSVVAYNVTINGKEYKKETTDYATDQSCFTFIENKRRTGYTISSTCTSVLCGDWTCNLGQENTQILCDGGEVDGFDLVSYYDAELLEDWGVIDIEGESLGTVRISHYLCGGFISAEYPQGMEMYPIIPKTSVTREVKNVKFNMDKCLSSGLVADEEQLNEQCQQAEQQMTEMDMETLKSMALMLPQIFDLEYGDVIKELPVTGIGSTAFHTYTSFYSVIKGITIPETITKIAPDAFNGQDLLDVNAIIIQGDATRFDSIWEDIGFPAK